MNILMALSQLEVTGAEVYATELGNALAARGHRLFYVSDTLSKSVEGTVFRLRFNRRSPWRRLWHIAYLVYLIRRHRIQLVHAHSRASGWSSYVACRLTGTPMLSSVHGRQPVHASRKRFHAVGYKALAVCEAVAEQIADSLGIPRNKVEVIRNGFDLTRFSPRPRPNNAKPVLAIIGRLTGPKGELCYRLLDEVLDLQDWTVRVVTGSAVPPRFERFRGRVDFRCDVRDMPAEIAACDLVIGAGRVAVEAMLCGTPVFAVGEARALGLITQANLLEGMACNFGDIGPQELDIDFKALRAQFVQALETKIVDSALGARIAEAYDLARMTERIEAVYQSAVVHTLRREIPILMYHRFIETEAERGIHGTWMWVDRFESHLRLLKRLGYETLTFADFEAGGLIRRLQPGGRYVMLTADDGYRDNLSRMLPLLRRYGFRAVVYVVSAETHNRWDIEGGDPPDVRVDLMTADEIRALADSGLVEIGGHTLSHAKLDLLTPEEQAREIREDKAALEAIIGRPLQSFAYPYGRLNDSAKQQAALAGYRYAVATDSGPLAMHEDLFQIRRIAVFPRTDVFGLWRKIRGNYVFRRAR